MRRNRRLRRWGLLFEGRWKEMRRRCGKGGKEEVVVVSFQASRFGSKANELDFRLVRGLGEVRGARNA